MNSLQIDEEKLSDVITNLELAQHQIKIACESVPLDAADKERFRDVILLIRDSIDILRNFEIRNEIERFSAIDDDTV